MTAELHPSIVALVSLSANIAANHPSQGLCQVEKLKGYGVTDDQIDLVVEIARHIRDEASQKLDAQFDASLKKAAAKAKLGAIGVSQGACCTPTPSGKSCC
jgi:hypothetical protein